ncbi:pilin [Candidatus Nomurabacteria bacterium]|nr:pilin [Candidatus Nomurabacteria bacterium]
MKKILSKILIPVTISLFLIIFIIPTKVDAKSLCDVFIPATLNIDSACYKNLRSSQKTTKSEFKISIKDTESDITDNSVKINVKILMNPQASDVKTNTPQTSINSSRKTILKGFTDGVLDEEVLGGWDSIYNEKIEDNENSGGIFLIIKSSEDNSEENIIKKVSLSKFLTDFNYQNIQYLTLTAINIDIPVKELKAKTKYYAFLKTQEELDSGTYISSDTINFTTKDAPVSINNNATQVNTDTLYAPLQQLPGVDQTIDTADRNSFAKYFNIIINLFFGICAVLAMIMIVIGGIEYMTSELVSSKESGKSKITQAIFGLLLALGAYTILNTINPDLLNISLNGLPRAEITISPTDTSTGSDTSLCISTNPPNPDTATGSAVTLNDTIKEKYLPSRDTITNLSTGTKLLITAQTHMEGFFPGSKSFRTNNPGNIGNTDDGSTKTFSNLKDGIQAQGDIVTRVANNTSTSYQIGKKIPCALGDETYNGSLYQYLRIYSTSARFSNVYLNTIIGFFKDNGKTITARTKISDLIKVQ